MLGHQESQPGLAELYLWSGRNKPLVEEGSFYDRFAKLRPTLLRDEDFAHWYAEGKGRPSVPPSLLAGAFLLALRDNCSDREAEQRMTYDLRWKWALNLGLDHHGCDHSSLCVFRARLLAHAEEGWLFTELVRKAVEAGLLPRRTLQVLDSSPMLGAAAVEDTYKLLRRALHLVVKAHEKALPQALKERLKRYRTAAKPKLDWQDPAARRAELNRLVEDAEAALTGLPENGEWPTVNKARQLLERVAKQDLEEDPEGGVRIRQGVAEDRVVSTADPEMRHGRKSSTGSWNGYKKHLSVEPTTELITAVAVTAANRPDGPVALELLQQQQKVGLAPAEVVGDMAYGSGELRAQALALGEGTTILTRAAALPESGGYFSKADFQIDCGAGIVLCPAGQTATFRFRSGHRGKATFSRRACAACPLASSCLRGSQPSRVIHIEAHEDQLQAARQRREQPGFALLLAQRPTVERKLAHWNLKGGRESRYFGHRKTLLQAYWSAALVNLERLMVFGAPFAGSPAGSASNFAHPIEARARNSWRLWGPLGGLLAQVDRLIAEPSLSAAPKTAFSTAS